MIARIAFVLALVASVAHAQTPEQLYMQGQHAYDEKRYDDAIAAWTKSYDASHLPGLLFNIAQAYRLHGDCAQAVASYKKFLELDPKSPQRATAQSFVAELTPCPVAQPEPSAPPPPPAPVVAPPQPVQPTPMPAQPVDTNPGHGKRLAGVVVAGGSVLVVATGLYFGHKASQLGDEVTAACKMGCIWSSVQSKDAEGKSDEKKQWILLGVGAAGLVAGGVLYYLGSDESAHHVAIVPHADGATVSWIGRW